MGERLGILVAEQDDCPYLEGQFRSAIALAPVNDQDIVIQYPKNPVLKNLTQSMVPAGFHAGHLSVSFNNCLYCKACIPLRIRVRDYPFSESNLRILKACKDLKTKIGKPALYKPHYDLYRKYIRARHSEDSEDIKDFIEFESVMSRHEGMIETYSTDKKLISVTLYDRVENGVYGFDIFYDPEAEQARLSLGTLAYLQLIAVTQNHGLDYLYIGNWVKNGKGSDYKKRYKNLEAATENGWVPFDELQNLKGPDYLKLIPANVERKIIVIQPVR
jgi:arginyl-tRNA--protein-N-Asp/Glu arginylyltransferase